MKKFFSDIWTNVITSSATWVTTAFLSLLTVLSQTLTDHIKTGLNNADARITCYESMSKDFSTLIFNAENFIENYQQAYDSLKAGSISTKNLKETGDAYNTSITTVRSNEYAYRYQINTYAKWTLKIFTDSQSKEYEVLMQDVKRLDAAIHEINPVGKKIQSALDQNQGLYLLEPTDTPLLGHCLPLVKTYLQQTQKEASDFFNSL